MIWATKNTEAKYTGRHRMISRPIPASARDERLATRQDIARARKRVTVRRMP